MKDIRAAPILPRGRVAKWSKEQIDKLTTLELRALLANAERLKETEVVALCNELLHARPRGHALVRRHKQAGEARRLVTRGKAFEMNGVRLRNRVWSCGGLRTDGAVLLSVRALRLLRSEEHTSELQSLAYLVCRLLLEKKKKN